MSQSTTAVPPRRRRPVPTRDLLDYAKSGLKRFRRARGHERTSRVVDGEVLAWQERVNVTVAREQQEERASKDMEQAAAVLTRMAIIEESRVCWWIQKDGS